MVMEYDELTLDETEKLKALRRQKIQVIKNIEAIKSELYEVTSQIESFGFPVDCEDPAERRRILGCQEFNNNPKQGLEYLFEQGLLERNPTSVARFFVEEHERLSKVVLGTYLGEVRKEFNMEVLDAFTRLHDFRNQEFLPSLRHFLLSFQLPGESQKIDRILTSFAEWYLEQNPTMFRSPHEAYVLAYAAILLNTTLHNTNAKSQTLGLADEKVFVRTLLDYDRETDLPEDLIRRVYQDIKNEPIRAASDDGLDGISQNGKVLMKGWLLKLGGRVKSWKRRWFVLTENSLVYYTTPDRQRNVKGVIPLDGLNIRLSQERTKENSFELFSIRNEVIKASKADKDGSSAPGHHTTYRLAAATTAERDRWIRMLESVTHKIAERRGARSTSVDCTTGTGSVNPRLSTRFMSASLKRSVGAGSHPDLPSQQSALNNH
ncbi:Cytohesin-3 [Clonorchis sinensis]|uniref:Cytohesin-3 n=1 Tax=Clonorchis sinensis TaxID=79923 RepID=A0A8T1N0E0_CLOSI|nr:Cytohesin-3 [Clonorchis sinensis]